MLSVLEWDWWLCRSTLSCFALPSKRLLAEGTITELSCVVYYKIVQILSTFKSNLIWLGDEHVAMLSSGSTEVVWPVPHFNVDRQFCVPLAPTCTYNPLSVLFQWLLSVIISYTTLHDNTSAFGLTAKRIARTCYSPYHGRCAGRQRMNNSLRNTKNRLNRTETMHSTLCFDITTLLAWLPYLHPHA